MKKLAAIYTFFILAVLGVLISGCTIEPVQPDHKVEIKGAPDWVNKGSYFGGKDGRMFYGVGSVTQQSDMALQKSVADDKSVAEVAGVLSSYLESVSNEYMASSKPDERGFIEDSPGRRIEDAATRLVKDNVSHQIDEAISHQFKGSVPNQLKEEISRQIKEDFSRQIRGAITFQIDFTRDLEEAISTRIKEAVARQIKSTTKNHLSGIKIVGSWRDPKTNTMWSISELDLKSVKSTMAGVKEMSVELRDFFEANADSIFDRVVREKIEKENGSFFSFK